MGPTLRDKVVSPVTRGAVNTGSPDVPNLGEITFYPHKITQTQMQEILYAGYTFEEIAEGKVPYLPPKETSDFVATKHDKSFAEAQEERAAAAKEVSFCSPWTKPQSHLIRLANMISRVHLESSHHQESNHKTSDASCKLKPHSIV